jgi:hypothetical protein
MVSDWNRRTLATKTNARRQSLLGRPISNVKGWSLMRYAMQIWVVTCSFECENYFITYSKRACDFHFDIAIPLLIIISIPLRSIPSLSLCDDLPSLCDGWFEELPIICNVPSSQGEDILCNVPSMSSKAASRAAGDDDDADGENGESTAPERVGRQDQDASCQASSPRAGVGHAEASPHRELFQRERLHSVESGAHREPLHIGASSANDHKQALADDSDHVRVCASHRGRRCVVWAAAHRLRSSLP